MSGRVERLAGEVEAAERELRKGRELFHEMGERARYMTMSLELGDALCELGRFDEVESILAEVESTTPDVDAEFLLASLRGKLLAYRGDPAGAELARRGAALAAQTDDYTWRGDALDNLVAVLVALGRTHEALDALHQALDVHRGKGNLVGAQRAEALLAELAAAPLPQSD